MQIVKCRNAVAILRIFASSGNLVEGAAKRKKVTRKKIDARNKKLQIVKHRNAVAILRTFGQPPSASSGRRWSKVWQKEKKSPVEK